MKIEKCAFCNIKKVKKISNYVEHHLNGKKTGETIILCNKHHLALHGYIRKTAVELCRTSLPDFFTKVTEEYKKILGGE